MTLDVVHGTFTLRWRDDPYHRAALMFLGHLKARRGSDPAEGERLLELARAAGGVSTDDELVEHF